MTQSLIPRRVLGPFQIAERGLGELSWVRYNDARMSRSECAEELLFREAPNASRVRFAAAARPDQTTAHHTPQNNLKEVHVTAASSFIHRGPRRRALALIAAAVTAAGLTACGSSSSSNSSSASSGSSSSSSGAATSASVSTAPGNATSGTINWWASPISTGAVDVRKVWIAAFEKAYPNIKVNLITAPTDTDTNRATLTTQISGGAGPDVYMGDVIWPAQFGAHQLAVPLSKYLPASYWATFAPGLVAGATYKGQVYGAPLFEDQGFLYYRKDLLAKDNLPVPTTWEQMVSDAKTMQSKGQVKYGYVFQGADYEGATCDFMEFLADAGGSGAEQRRDERLANVHQRGDEGADVRALARDRRGRSEAPTRPIRRRRR